jgi:glycosyltransferase involved in cell wall biosynthesis
MGLMEKPHQPASVSLVIPVYNEEDNIRPLYDQLCHVMDKLDRPVEAIFIDDGSKDSTSQRLAEMVNRDDRIRVVRFRRNYGQTAAMQAGLEYASGDIIVTLDGDLQNDPDDIPMMLAKIDEGYDLVHGWRKNRQDTLVTRKIPSRVANYIISRVTRFPIHDLGCTLKAMRREIADELELYGEMHRFIPILANWRGAKCVEVETRHHPRIHGTTKYGLSRTIRVILDLITVKYMLDYYTSPMKLFGRIGLGLMAFGGLSLVSVVAMKFLNGTDMTGNPLLLLGVMLSLMSLQALSVGLLGESTTRLYYTRDSRRPFSVREVLGQSLESPTIPFPTNRTSSVA